MQDTVEGKEDEIRSWDVSELNATYVVANEGKMVGPRGRDEVFEASQEGD
jgi:hypothetical protein